MWCLIPKEVPDKPKRKRKTMDYLKLKRQKRFPGIEERVPQVVQLLRLQQLKSMMMISLMIALKTPIFR